VLILDLVFSMPVHPKSRCDNLNVNLAITPKRQQPWWFF